mmetsp:Transcript_46408/g.120034  ORF Transcript_46408/g.120034 Transcript_46408/m.120034 type:complete len:226 (+) Transcript_46408:2158-2835(+)
MLGALHLLTEAGELLRGNSLLLLQRGLLHLQRQCLLSFLLLDLLLEALRLQRVAHAHARHYVRNVIARLLSHQLPVADRIDLRLHRWENVPAADLELADRRCHCRALLRLQGLAVGGVRERALQLIDIFQMFLLHLVDQRLDGCSFSVREVLLAQGLQHLEATATALASRTRGPSSLAGAHTVIRGQQEGASEPGLAGARPGAILDVDFRPRPRLRLSVPNGPGP